MDNELNKFHDVIITEPTVVIIRPVLKLILFAATLEKSKHAETKFVTILIPTVANKTVSRPTAYQLIQQFLMDLL